MTKQYIPPGSTGLINCLPVKAIKTSSLRKSESGCICDICVFGKPPFKCDFLCSCRPACMANDPENVNKISILFVSI